MTDIDNIVTNFLNEILIYIDTIVHIKKNIGNTTIIVDSIYKTKFHNYKITYFVKSETPYALVNYMRSMLSQHMIMESLTKKTKYLNIPTELTIHIENDKLIINLYLIYQPTKVPYTFNKLNLVSDNYTNYLSDLPHELIQKIIIHYPYDEILNICSISKYLNLICNTETFWRNKFIYDYGYNPPFYKNDIETFNSSNPYIRAKSLRLYYINMNSVLTFGLNDKGQLGLGHKCDSSFDEHSTQKSNNVNIPTYVYIHDDNSRYIVNPTYKNKKHKAKFISCGGNFTILIDTDNKLWGMGENNKSQLIYNINSNINNENVPCIINNNNKHIVYISSGNYNNLLIDDNFNLYQTGFSQIYNVRSIFTKIENNIKFKYITSGSTHVAGIDINNNLYLNGFNLYGQTSIAKTNLKVKHVACGANYTMIIDENDNVFGFGFNGFGQLGSDNNFNMKAKYIACGSNHTILIDMENNVWSAGLNKSGQLGLGTFLDHTNNIFKQINGIKAKYAACGLLHTVLITLNDDILSFGSNEYGQLGLCHNIDINIPTKINNIKAKTVSCGKYHTAIISL